MSGVDCFLGAPHIAQQAASKPFSAGATLVGKPVWTDRQLESHEQETQVQETLTVPAPPTPEAPTPGSLPPFPDLLSSQSSVAAPADTSAPPPAHLPEPAAVTTSPATPSTPARACSSHKPATPSTPARACAQSPSQRYAAKARPKYFDKHACISNPPCQAAFACDPRDIQSRSRSSHLDIPWSRPWSLSIRLIKRYTHRTRRFWWVRFPSSAAATEQTGSLLLAASPLLHPESQWHFEVQPGSHEVVAHSRREFPGLELFFFISGVRKYAMGMSQNRRPETFSCNYKTKFRDPLFWDIPL